MKISRLLLTALLLFVLTFCSGAVAATGIPAKPDRFDYVYDYGGILSEQDTAKIRSIGTELERKTTTQIIVVAVDSLEGMPIEEYANTIFRSWGIGSAEKNNGILILVNKENMLKGKSQRIRIEVGYGLEGAVPDGAAGRILDEQVLPRWEQQLYSEGVAAGYLGVAFRVAGEYNVNLDGASPAPGQYRDNRVPTTFTVSDPVVIFVLVIFIIFINALIRRKRRRNRWGDDDDGFGGGGGWGGFGGGGGWGGGGGFGGGGFGGGSSGGGGAGR